MDETKKIVDVSDRFFWLIAILIGAAVIYFLASMSYQFRQLPQNAPQQINVVGEGKAFVKPDVATVSFGMQSQGLKSQDVVNENNTVINRVTDAVKKLGVEEKDIQTTGYNLSPWYDYTERGRIFRGYQLMQQVSVKIRNFDKISEILESITSNGANTVSDLRFTVDDPVKAQAEARAKAIAQAKEKAKTMIEGTGLRLEKIINISEGSNPPPQPLYAYGMGGATKDAMNVAPEVQAGQMEVNSMVTLTYLVK